MKKLAFLVIVMQIFVGNIFALTDIEITNTIRRHNGENLSEQQFKLHFEFWAIEDFADHTTASTEFRTEYLAAIRISDRAEQVRQLQSIRTRIRNRCRLPNTNSTHCALVNDRNRIFENLMAQRDTQWARYRAAPQVRREQEAARRANQDAAQQRNAERQAEQARQQATVARLERERRNNQVFCDEFVRVANLYFQRTLPQRGEFESTQDFNNRLNTFFNDSTEYLFRKFALMVVDRIVGQTGRITARLGNYDADAETFSLVVGIEGVTLALPQIGQAHISGTYHTVSVAVPRSEAQGLRGDGFTVSMNLADVGILRNERSNTTSLFPKALTLINRNRTGEYPVNVPLPANSMDIVFRGNILWANNPQAKNVELRYADLVNEAQNNRREQERVARQERIATHQRQQQQKTEQLEQLQRQERERAEQQRLARERREKEDRRRRVWATIGSVALTSGVLIWMGTW